MGKRLILVAGMQACGKTTVSALLAEELKALLIDKDDVTTDMVSQLKKQI